MNFEELKLKASVAYPGILMDRLGTHVGRKKFRTIFMLFLAILFGFMVIGPIFGLTFVVENIFVFRGLFFLILVFWAVLYLFEAMYLSYYFRESDISFEVAKIVYNTGEGDMTLGFLESVFGQYTMLRLGISNDEVDVFLKNRTDFVSTGEYMIVLNKNDPYVALSEYARTLLHFDMDLKTFLVKKGITSEIFKGAVEWVSSEEKKVREIERWWQHERLMKIPSIGKNWSFGKVYLLEKYGHSIFFEQSFRHLGDKWRLYREYVNLLEQVLVKEDGSNIMLVSDDHATGMEIVSSLAKEIINGTTVPALESKRIFVLDGSVLIDSLQDKATFEAGFFGVLNQAAGSGNVILVIPNISGFILSAHSIESNVAELMEEALASTNVQIIAISNKKGYHESVETNHDLMRYFEKITIEGLGEEGTVKLVEDEANYLEAKYKIIFTYQSLVAIVESAKRYFSEGALSDKALDLLHEVTPKLVKKGDVLISEEDISELVEAKTGIPQGKIDDKEREKLVNLKDVLHERIIGQDRALRAISDALKRVRAGLNNPNRPMGSFLFLGPTGVGKTETTKALAETYFGDEGKIMRLDMSEFTGGDAMEKLIGSFNSEKPGVLASRLREQQYGVLLLDEFEKTTPQVMDLFLQILDEGFFTDGRDEKINARNVIIIATSNAGSDLIYEATKNGESLEGKENEIVDNVIGRGIFKPELVNRFDDTIVFHTLTRSHLKKVATLMLRSLNKRLEGKGMKVLVNDDILNYLVKMGTNPKFGAREMNRAVQDNIEGMIADKIIDNTISKGDTIIFTTIDGKLVVNAE